MTNFVDYRYVPWGSLRNEIKKVVIGDGVTNIGKFAFDICNNLTSVTIPNTVTSIGYEAFNGCKSLTSVTIPNSVTSIGDRAFSACESLTSIAIPNSVTSIGNFAFSDCSGLTSVTIPNSVTSIGDDAFSLCSGLTSITIPNSVMSIGSYAFDGCSGLTTITIPKSVKSIGISAFSGCKGLNSIVVEEENKKYDSRNNCNAIIEKKTNTLIAGCKNTIIPNSVTSIGGSAFGGCSGLTSITIPNSVTSIEDGVFAGCTGLTSVTVPNSVTSIGSSAFEDCSGLTSVTIPNSVTSIGNFAFFKCKGLTSITFKGSTPPTFGNDVFYYVDKSIPVYVPAPRGETYKNALAGYGFSNIKEFTSISLKDNSNAYTRNTQIDDADVSYTRDFSKYWEPLYIPFSLKYEDWKDDFEIAYINAVHQYDTNDDGDIDKTVLEFVKIKSGTTYPNTPYIIRAKEKGKKTLYAENVTLYESDVNQIKCSTTAQEFIFTGNYKKVSTMDLMAYYTNKYTMHLGDINYISLITGVGAYRWYMEIKDRESVYGINNNNTAKEISIKVVGEETTGIANIQHKSPDTQIYDLNGRKVNENNLKPGMYVKNGRKFVVR